MDTVLWRVRPGQQDEVRCVMISCCTGAELQVLRDGEIIVRELYPSKSDLYERARGLYQEIAEPNLRRYPT